LLESTAFGHEAADLLAERPYTGGNPIGGGAGLVGQALHLGGNDRETAAGLARPGGPRCRR